MSDDVESDFTQWVVLRRTALLRTAWLLTGERHEAEDLVQSTVLRCWLRWSRIRRTQNIDAYVNKTMANTFLSGRRRRWHREVPTEILPEPVAAQPSSDDRADLLRALSRLSRRQRAVIVLRYAEDLSVRQTAELLGCSIGNIKSQTSRALEQLRLDSAETLGEEY